jgi:predicted alpha/beta-fold hydrolase
MTDLGALGLFSGSIAVSLVASRAKAFLRRTKGVPSVLYHNTSKVASKVALLREKLMYGYPTSLLFGLLDPVGFYQTVATVLTRKLYFSQVKYDRELLKLKDGGTVGVDWTTTKNRQSKCPVVVVQHGLCGHSQSGYVKSMVNELQKAGFYVVVFVARGCGKVALTTPETFTASRTTDFGAVLAHVQEKCPGREIHTVGFSLGAGLLLKYLGEHGDNTVLTSAVAICPSFDFHIKTKTFESFSAATCQALRSLVKSHREYLEHHPDSKLDWDGMMNARNILQFDEAAIVGKDKTGKNYVHHPSTDDYYTQSSCIRYSHAVKVPTLCVVAQDDPVCAIEGAPSDLSQVGEGLVLLKIAHGGHIGFASGGNLLSRSFWCDEISAVWFQANKG